MNSTVDVLGIALQNLTLGEAADDLTRRAVQGLQTRVFFVNAHCFNVASVDARYAGALKAAEVRYADGTGMRWAAACAGHRLADNVNGTDLFPHLCERAAAADLPIALLGARPGVAERCAKAMIESYPRLRMAWVHDGYWDPEREDDLIDDLNRSGARLLFVAMGVPRQELWIHDNAERLAPPVKLAVGALFDFFSGDLPRAPEWMRRAGMEWCFRLYLEPRRLAQRYMLGNPMFLFRVLRAMLKPSGSGLR